MAGTAEASVTWCGKTMYDTRCVLHKMFQWHSSSSITYSVTHLLIQNVRRVQKLKKKRECHCSARCHRQQSRRAGGTNKTRDRSRAGAASFLSASKTLQTRIEQLSRY